MEYHVLEIDKVFKETGSSPSGLSKETVEQKLSEFGPNELEEKKKKPAWVLFLNQFKDFMIIVLIAAAVVSGIAGDLTDTIIILVIVLLNAVIGFVQEYRAGKAMDALKKMAAFQVQVIRNGKTINIPSRDLVVGDLVLLEAGNAVPADLRLSETHSLSIDESALTGESVATEKNEQTLSDAEIPVADRLNIAYKGTLVTKGRATGIVVATGMNTEIGRIAKMLQHKEPLTPLQRRMGDFGKKLSYLILFICLLLFVVGLVRGEEPLSMLLLSISLAVAAIPEALPALITIALAKGARRLVKKNALIRKLSAVETLGSVTFICTDKTGTLTLNKMKVVDSYPESHDIIFQNNYSALESAMVLNNDAKPAENDTLVGDPTETALVEFFINDHSASEVTDLLKTYERVQEFPFDSDRKRMTTIHKYDEKFLVISKGAAESIDEILEGSGNSKMLETANDLAAKGERVLAFAYKVIDALPSSSGIEEVEQGLSYAGLVSMIDPPREEVKDAIKECKAAGIKVVMITGDHPATAAAIATKLGILVEGDLTLTGTELQKLPSEEFEEKVERIRVYARVSPEQKLNIVNALQNKNQYVSMTGDGVNDAPSLKSANIGVAMGISGTDVSKEAAHMILLDDNFTTIVKAVREGRRIYDNIRKFVKYIMTGNGAEIWAIFLAPFAGLPIPLLPIHILWINLVTDGLPGLALAGEKAEKDIMKRPPRKTNESLFSGGIGYHIIWVGLFMAGVTLGVEAWAVQNEKDSWQTMVFTVLAFSQLGHVLAIRSDKQLLIKQGIFSNLPLVGAVLLTVALQLVVIYLPYANTLFKTQPLTGSELLICVVASSVVFHAVEVEKLIKKRIRKHKASE